MAAILALVVLLAAPAFAQEPEFPEPPAEPGAPTETISPTVSAPAQESLLPPAYEGSMLRLAEVLGSLHYLRDLCGSKEGQLWRQQMEEMLAMEEPTAARRAQLVARFNRGFRTFREIYRECTPVAAEAANRYLREGMRLAGEIPSRYGR